MHTSKPALLATLFLTLLATSARSEMHVVTAAPILSAADAKGVRTQLSSKMVPTMLTVDAVTKQVTKVTTKPAEYHLIVPNTYAYQGADVSYAATWDFKSPCIEVLKGDPSTLSLGFLGWPTISCTAWKAANPTSQLP